MYLHMPRLTDQLSSHPIGDNVIAVVCSRASAIDSCCLSSLQDIDDFFVCPGIFASLTAVAGDSFRLRAAYTQHRHFQAAGRRQPEHRLFRRTAIFAHIAVATLNHHTLVRVVCTAPRCCHASVCRSHRPWLLAHQMIEHGLLLPVPTARLQPG